MVKKKKNIYKIISSILIIFLIVLLGIFISIINENKQDNQEKKEDLENKVQDDPEKVVVYFFWGIGCPHCAEEKPFLEELEDKYPKLEVKMFETYKSPDNAKLFQEVAKAYDTTARGVPVTFVGDQYWVGYSSNIGEQIENKIKYCIENDCINPTDKLE